MIYGSVCSGIEAATVAWHPLGWRPAFFAEIEKYPSAVLKHHYAGVPNHGDFTTIQRGDYEPIDLLVGGTPCQDFSVAGLRAGMDGERGNLTLEFLRLADRLRPRWLVWENVPGVLSSTSHRAPDPCPPPDPLDMESEPEEVVVEDEYDASESHALNSFVAGLSELGYGWAMRVLDAQHFGLPQRRRRVFVVGYLGDWRRAAAVLFERHSLSGHPAPRREETVANVCIAAINSCWWNGDHIAQTLDAVLYKGQMMPEKNRFPVVIVKDRARRITPIEAERCFGFPDDYTKISDKTADGPRYKALGNSMAVPCMRWIGERIAMVEAL